jgi:hypothetical protein
MKLQLFETIRIKKIILILISNKRINESNYSKGKFCICKN